MTGAIDTLTPDQQLEAIYVGYFGRGADSGGFTFWEQQYAAAISSGQTADQALTNVADSFAPQPETKALYPALAGLTPPFNINSTVQVNAVTAFVNEVYQNLFGHGLAAGDTYWVDQILNNVTPIGTAILGIANGAIGVDATTIHNKITVAESFTDQTSAAGQGFGTPSAAYLQEATSVVAGTTSDPATVTTQEAAIGAFVSGAASPTFILTTGIDSGTAFTTSADNAVFDAPVAINPVFLTPATTLNTGDILTDTGANGTLNAAFAGSGFGGGTFIAATIHGIATYNLTNSSGDDVDLAAANLTGLTTVNDLNSNSDIIIGAGDSLATAVTTVGLTNLGGGIGMGINESVAALAGTADALTVNVTDIGTSGDASWLDIGSGVANGVESITVNSVNTNGNGNFLALGTDSGTTVTSLAVTGSGAIQISSDDPVGSFTHVTSIDASAATGNVVITGAFSEGAGDTGFLDGNTVLTSAKFGAGDDSIDVSSFTTVGEMAALTADGGAGTNTIIMDDAILTGGVTATFANITHFQTFADADPGSAGATIDMAMLPTSVDEIQFLNAMQQDMTINNGVTDLTVALGPFDENDFSLTINAAGVGIHDALTVVLGDTTGPLEFLNPLNINGYEAITLEANGATSTDVNILETNSEANTFTASPGGSIVVDVTGDAGLETNSLMLNGNGTSVVATNTGTLEIDSFSGGAAVAFSTNAASIDAHLSGGLFMTGFDTNFNGSIGDVITGSAAHANTIVGSVANDVLTGGTAGDNIWTDGGADTIALGAAGHTDNVFLTGETGISGSNAAVALSIADDADLAQPGFWGVAPGATPVDLTVAGPFLAGTGTSVSMSTVANFTAGATGDVVDFSVGAWGNAAANNGLTGGTLAVGSVVAGNDAVIGTQTAGTTVAANVTLVEITDHGFANAAALAAGLQGSEHLIFSGAPGAGFDSHILVAYNNTTSGSVTIADVDIRDIGGVPPANNDTQNDSVIASDMVQLTGVASVTALNAHNVHFV